jgi:hypothetical protein
VRWGVEGRQTQRIDAVTTWCLALKSL